VAYGIPDGFRLTQKPRRGVNEPAGEDQESSGDDKIFRNCLDAGVFGIGHDATIIGGSDKECKREAAPSRIYEVG
jgi:hypothetical protein